jgi:hypothetical protein
MHDAERWRLAIQGMERPQRVAIDEYYAIYADVSSNI